MFIEYQRWYYVTDNWEFKTVHTFPKFISSKLNVIRQVEF